MEEAQIDKAVILPLDYGVPLGDPPVPIDEVNRTFAQLQRRHEDRLLAFVSVDPRRPQARSLVPGARLRAPCGD